MELTFGSAQKHTSKKMRSHPFMSIVFSAIFGYTNVGNYARFTIFRELMKNIPIGTKPKVLDLGAGYGEYSISLATALPKADIHALDIDESRIRSIEEALHKSGIDNVHTHCVQTENLNESDFNFIFSVDVFEHISSEEMPFRASYERLKTNGYLLVKIPNRTQRTILPERWFEKHHEWLKDEHIGQIYDLESLKQRFIEEGFRLVHAAYSDGWFSRLGWELAYLGKRMGVITQLLTLPISKGLIQMDRLIHQGNWGNAIQVIGQKI